MSLDNVIQINISRSAPAVTRQGFGTMLILGPNASGWGGDKVRAYTGAAAMLLDGFESTDAEYVAAQRAFGQVVKPPRVLVGLRAAPVAMVRTITPTAFNETAYSVTIDGEEYEFTSDEDATANEIVAGLLALINGDVEAKVTASGTATLILTADKAGVPFTLEVGTNLTVADTTPNSGVIEDLAAVSAADNEWYGLDLVSRDADEIELAADYCESAKKLFVPVSSSGDILTSVDTDLASRLKAKSLDRTALLYSGSPTQMPDAGIFGRMLPTDPGSATWKFKTIAGVTVDKLSATQQLNATNKNANVYIDMGGRGIFAEGMVASGEFIDVIIGIDWIHVNMQADVFQVFLDVPKVPYTNDGFAMIESVVRRRLQLAVEAGILASFTVTTIPVEQVDPADKAARRFNATSFTGVLAGAVHSTVINGSVSV